ncbi:unnamed protein product [Gordionus sp. m RMFG-2023]|uniref:eukaryotic translation initiation factor 4B-like isoform X2 n=1 Tax=Gordionus sp. m RMFG-2023 TaxID=3053472 RepID=UPI0030E0F6FF
MATSGKKKPKKIPIELGTSVSSWAHEMEHNKIDSTHITYGCNTAKTFPSAPRAAYENIEDFSHIPDKPPFRIQLKNLPYLIESSQIEKFFEKLKITELNLGTKGIGQIEFNSRNDMIEAMKKNQDTLSGRTINIEVATYMPYDNRSNNYGKYQYQTDAPWKFQDTNNPSFNYENRSRDSNRRGSDYASSNRNSQRNYDTSYGSRNNLSNPNNSLHQQQTHVNRAPYTGSMSDYGKSTGFPPNSRFNESNSYTGRDNISADGEKKPAFNLSKLLAENPDDPTPIESKKYASIFGEAKPVDTASVEARIEAKLIQQERDKSLSKTSTTNEPPIIRGRNRLDSGSEKLMGRSASIGSFEHNHEEDNFIPANHRGNNYRQQYHNDPFLPPYGKLNNNPYISRNGPSYNSHTSSRGSETSDRKDSLTNDSAKYGLMSPPQSRHPPHYDNNQRYEPAKYQGARSMDCSDPKYLIRIPPSNTYGPLSNQRRQSADPRGASRNFYPSERHYENEEDQNYPTNGSGGMNRQRLPNNSSNKKRGGGNYSNQAFNSKDFVFRRNDDEVNGRSVSQQHTQQQTQQRREEERSDAPFYKNQFQTLDTLDDE